MFADPLARLSKPMLFYLGCNQQFPSVHTCAGADEGDPARLCPRTRLCITLHFDLCAALRRTTAFRTQRTAVSSSAIPVHSG